MEPHPSSDAPGLRAAQAPARVVMPDPGALVDAAGALPGVERALLERGELVLHARRDELPALLLALRDDPSFACEQMMDLCAVDWPERPERFEVVYNLLSVSLNHRVRVVARTAEGTPVPSIHAIWPVATWFERVRSPYAVEDEIDVGAANAGEPPSAPITEAAIEQAIAGGRS